MLIKANHNKSDLHGVFDSYEMKKFGQQISMLFEYDSPTNGYKIFVENWGKLFDVLFEIYMKATRNDCRNSLITIDLRNIWKKAKSKLKDVKQFNLHLFKKLIECTAYINSHWEEIDSKSLKYLQEDSSDKSKSCLNVYYDFVREFIEYIAYEVTDIKTCCKPCLDLLIELSKSAHLSKDYLRIIYDLLWKDNFFVLKDFATEIRTLSGNLLELPYEFEESDGDFSDLAKDRFDSIDKILRHLCQRIEKFPESKNVVQEILLEKVFYKPIERKVLSNSFYDLIDDPFELFDPVYLFNSCKDMFTKALILFVSNEVIEAIQPENTIDKSDLKSYFNKWFEHLGKLLATEKNFDPKFTNNLIKIVDEIYKLDNFIDAFDSERFTVNFEIIRSLSGAFENPDSSAELITSLIKIWSLLSKKDNTEFNECFYNYLYHASQNHPKSIVPIAGELWELYLKDLNNDFSQILMVLCEILPLTSDLFMTKYRKRFLDAILKNINTTFLKNYSLFIKLFETCPEFYFQVDEDKKMCFTKLIEKMKKSSDNAVLMSIVGIFYYVIKAATENEKVIKDMNQVILNHRKEFWHFVYIEGVEVKNNQKLKLLKLKDFSTQWAIHQIGDVYLLLLKISKDRKTLAKQFVDELIDYYKRTEPKTDQPFYVVDIITKIGLIDNKAYLEPIRKYRDFFVETKNALKSNPEAISSLSSILDLIDNRNLETFANILTEAEKNIIKIGENLAEKDAEIKALDENLRETEKNVSSIKSEVNRIGDRVETMTKQIEEQNARIDKLDEKTLFNVPPWCGLIKSSMGKKNQNWILVAKRLNFSDRDIKGWLNQIDPFMSMMQEWFIANKTSDAIIGLMKVFKELNNKECVQIIQENIDRIEEESANHFSDYNIDEKMRKNPAHVFICYEWSSKEKAELLERYLSDEINRDCGVSNPNDADNRINIWFDNGNMGGGVERNKRIDLGLRLCNVLVCLITSETNKDQTCLNQINLAIQLNKPIIPLLLDSKLKWPPSGSLGPILSEYLFIRFFQRPPKELTNDERYWPVDKFKELVMQLKQLVPFTVNNQTNIVANPSVGKEHPEVFISYQWDKQKQIIKLYEKLTSLGLKCWLDIHQMGGGDSLYFKIDEGIRNCALVISCVTMKYSQSANCRKEIALSDSVPKPIIPILIEKGLKYPPPGPMSPTLGVLKFIDFTQNFDATDDIKWEGEPFKDLLTAMQPYLPQKTVDVVTSRACIIA